MFFEPGEIAADLMALAGKPLDDWQAYVVRAARGQRADGRYAAFEVGINVPRQNGKNVIIEAVELDGLFMDPDCEVITHSAHLFSTARKAFRELEAIIRSSPDLFARVVGSEGKGLRDDVRGIKTSSAEMSIEIMPSADKPRGAKITYLARSAGSARGLTGDLVVLDEAYDLTADQIAAMMPTMAARTMDRNPQIYYTSSAGMPSSEVWEEVRARGLAGDSPRLAYFEWSADDDADSDDVDAWYQANPGLGVRIDEEYVAEAEYRGMDEERFRRERLGIWARVGDEQGLSDRQWARQLDEGSMPGDLVVFGLDVSPSRDSAAISVVSARGDGRLHVELVDHQVGTDWVVARAKELCDQWSPGGLVVDAGSAAGSLVGELLRARVKVIQVSGREYWQACGLAYDLFQQGALAHIGQEPLDEAVGNVKIKPKGDSLFTWARIDTAVTIGPWVAVTLAVAGWDKTKKRRPRKGGSSGWKVVAL
ncbi:terminase large subunit [Trueperella bialowiezensis]|uniref:terminase large subunit n=1 Tax=Trueperella bialowiezensis TaxID=312285 RepID=UPI0013E0138E|nr:terminase large subunit [Trueperella bialowiezensis]